MLKTGEGIPRQAPSRSDGIGWYLGVVGAGLLLVASLALGTLFYITPYQQVLALGRFTYNDEGFYQLGLAINPARYQALRVLLTATALAGLLVAVGILRRGQPLAPLVAEIRWGKFQLRRWWQRLPVSAQVMVLGLGTVLLGVRTWYLLYYPLGTDEVASYDYFVKQGAAAVTSFYPIPNNHIFFNLLAWLLAPTGWSPRLIMRLPTLVLGTVGSAVGFVLLARCIGIRLATLVTGLVGLGPLWVYYAAVGRGYFVQICLLQVGFFAALELLRPMPRYERLSWLGFITTSILGLYAIPTYTYPLASLLLGMGGYLLARQKWRRLGQLAGAGLVILLVSALLYTPIIAVSGWQQLTSNRYVAAKTAAQFWPPFRAILYETAAELFGPSLRLSGPAWLGTALLGWLVLRLRHRPGATPDSRLAWLAWAMVALPILFMAIQRVYAPVRTVLYVTFFGYLFAAWAVRLGWRKMPFRWRVPARWQWPLVVFVVLGTGAARLYRHQVQVQASRAETQQLQQAYGWLRTHQLPGGTPTRVWLYAPLHELFFAHYAGQEANKSLLLYSGGREGPARPYDFIVFDNYFLKSIKPLQPIYSPAYHDHLITIYSRQH